MQTGALVLIQLSWPLLRECSIDHTITLRRRHCFVRIKLIYFVGKRGKSLMGSSGFLPPLVLLKDYENNWHRYFDIIYNFFRQDFVTSKPNFKGKRFALKRHPLINGKEATFWHIISEGGVEGERLPDLRRCERIRWPRPIIEAVRSENVKCWKNKRKEEVRVVIALEDFSYVVVLADRGDYVLLWTAYCVEQEHRRQKLRKEYEAFLNEKS